ncbi:MAG: hypothetical protein U0905_12645 [Pirellulales bacterium]
MKSTRDEPVFSVEDWAWIGSKDGRGWLEEYVQERLSGKDPMPRLRKRLGDLRAGLIAYQIELRSLASRKFRNPERWLWTRTLLEQASDESSAALVASYYPPHVEVVDGCCGAGADGVALAVRARSCGAILAIDKDPVACELVRHNVRSHGLNIEVQQGEMESRRLPQNAWLHVDPDRRPDGHRTTHGEAMSPNFDQMARWFQECPGGSIKLAPATEIDARWRQELGVQFIGWGKSVRQQRLWWGCEAFASGSTTLSIAKQGNEWHHLTFTREDLIRSHDRVREWDSSSQWIGDTDPVVRAAKATPCIADQCQAYLLGDEHGYMMAEQATPSWFVDWFQVREQVSLDVKKLRKHLRAHNIGKLEIKKRGVEIDIEQLRRDLKLEGEGQATLFLAREGKRHLAILADRMLPEGS